MPEHPQVTLTVIDGPCKGLTASFDCFPVTIGRAEEAQFRLTEDLRVSRRHAQIATGEDGAVVVSDCDSRFGSYLGDRRIRKEAIGPGASIRIGECTIRVDWASKSADRMPPPLGADEGRRPWRVWLYGVLTIGVLAATFAVLRLPPREPPRPAATGDRLRAAREARNKGDLKTAIDKLESLARDEDSDTQYDESVELLADCKRLKRRFDVANRYEENLRLQGALDEWRMMLVDDKFLSQDDPLRGWVQTQQIERIEAKLRHLRKNGGPDS